MSDTKYVKFSGRMVIVGFGSIGQGVLPLFLRHIDMAPSQITIVTAEERGHDEARSLGVKFVVSPLTRENYKTVLTPLLGTGDVLVNVSVDVSSLALVEFCFAQGALYLDTCIEPWPGGYTDPSLSPSARSNYALRETALALRKKYPDAPTAVLTHGANPGLVSHFVKQALLDVARRRAPRRKIAPAGRRWRRSSASRSSTSPSATPKSRRSPSASANSSTPGRSTAFSAKARSRPNWAGAATRNTFRPMAGGTISARGAAIYLNRPGASTRVRSWTPLEGSVSRLSHHPWRIDFDRRLSRRSAQGANASYRPTVHYAYHPCDDAVLSLHELAGKNWNLQSDKRLMMDEIASGGIDELGVLLVGNKKGVYWYGSRLTVDEARKLAPYNNATSLQVTAPVLAGVIWALENPRRGIVEPDEMDFRRMLDICLPYLGEMAGVWGDWTPLQDRGRLFPEDLDTADPWQFKNIRVV